MSLQFPSAPIVGQVYDRYTWTGLVWDLTPGSGGGGGAGSDGFTFTQDTEPTATLSGQTWFDTSTGDSFVWVVDATSSQWVQFAPGGGGGASVPRVGGIFGRVAAQPFAAATFTTVAFDQTVFNNGITVTNDNTFSVPEDGEYAVTFTGNGFFIANLLIGGETWVLSSNSDNVVTGWGTMSGVLRLTAGQTFGVRVWNQAAGSVNAPRLEIWKLGDNGGRSAGTPGFASSKTFTGLGFTTTSVAAQRVPEFSTLVTPRTVNSKFKLRAVLYVGANTNCDDTFFFLMRGVGSVIQSVGASGVNATGYYRWISNGGGLEVACIVMEFVDSPNTTDPIDYGVAMGVRVASPVQQLYLNRRGSDTSVGMVSTFTVEEIL